MADAQTFGAEAEYARVLERARADPEVVGVVVFGSRAAGPFATDASDVDLIVVLADDAIDPERWHTPHGSPVEIWAMTLDAFRQHALPETATAWNRPAFLRVRIDLDRLDGEIARIVERKRRLDPDEAKALVRSAVDDFVNAAYRALRNLEGGRELEGRLDAFESIGPLLSSAFALESRVRPFNKWLRFELADGPLDSPTLTDIVAVVDRLAADPTPERLRDAFRRIETAARDHGHGWVIDGWEPDLAWLRGDRPDHQPAGASPRPSRNA